jgi:hypothetical protein
MWTQVAIGSKDPPCARSSRQRCAGGSFFYSGTQFTCFNSTNVQILTQMALQDTLDNTQASEASLEARSEPQHHAARRARGVCVC